MGYHADIHRRLTDVEETGGAFLSSLFLLSQGEELWKSSFVFVGQAHKSPHPSPRRTEPWSPPPLGFYFPATPTSWRVCACSLEAPFVLPFCIWGEGVSWILGGLAGSPITGIWAVALTGRPTPPLDASILGGASLRLLLTWLLSVLPSLFCSSSLWTCLQLRWSKWLLHGPESCSGCDLFWCYIWNRNIRAQSSTSNCRRL